MAGVQCLPGVGGVCALQRVDTPWCTPSVPAVQMWQRGRQMSKRDWTLLRVAVVACVNDVYFGRLFFGDPDTKQVHWDTDVRPSDATFLALKVSQHSLGAAPADTGSLLQLPHSCASAALMTILQQCGQAACAGATVMCGVCRCFCTALTVADVLACGGLMLGCNLQAGAPIYVKKSVWEACATPLRNSSTWPTINFVRREQDMRAGSSSNSSNSSGQRHGG